MKKDEEKKVKSGSKNWIIFALIFSVLVPIVGFAFAGHYLFWGGNFDKKTKKYAYWIIGLSSLSFLVNIILYG